MNMNDDIWEIFEREDSHTMQVYNVYAYELVQTEVGKFNGFPQDLQGNGRIYRGIIGDDDQWNTVITSYSQASLCVSMVKECKTLEACFG